MMIARSRRTLAAFTFVGLTIAACARGPAAGTDPSGPTPGGGPTAAAPVTDTQRVAAAPDSAATGPVETVAPAEAGPTSLAMPASSTTAPTTPDASTGATADAGSGEEDPESGPAPATAPAPTSAPASSTLAVATTAAAAGSAAAGTPIVRPPGWQPEDPSTHPLSIQRLRAQSYPGSDLVVVQELPAGSNYRRQVVAYESEGNAIRGLLTVPNGEAPATGWPVIIFNHGYIPPAQYRTTERYVAYQDAFARAGYITLKSDYRGHGSSEGEATSGRSSPAYTIDVLNGMASVLRRPDADANRVGMWGHSMGGSITLRAMVISDKIKAGVIWAGVVASYTDMFNRLGSPPNNNPNPNPNATPNRRGWRTDLVERFGTPDENPAAWDAVSPNAYLADISGPLQLHHGTNDHSVPPVYSQRLQEQMQAAGRSSELFVYQGDDHNLAASLRTALDRSVSFFDRYVKGEPPSG